MEKTRLNLLGWFTLDNQLRTFDDVKNHFKRVPSRILENTLNELCNKGLLYCVDSFVGKMYGLL